VRIWDKGSRELVSHMTQHKDAVCDVKVYHDDRHVISGARDGTFIIWDVFAEKRISSHICPTGGFMGLELASDQVGEQGGTPLPLTLLAAPGWSASRLPTLSPRQVQVVTVGLDRKLQFWDVRNQSPLQVIDKSHDGICTAVAASPGCEIVATGGADWVGAPPRLPPSRLKGAPASSAPEGPMSRQQELALTQGCVRAGGTGGPRLGLQDGQLPPPGFPIEKAYAGKQNLQIDCKGTHTLKKTAAASSQSSARPAWEVGSSSAGRLCYMYSD